MKAKHSLKLIDKQLLAKDTVELTFKNKYISMHAQPGQFIYIYLPNYTLRRPLSIASTNVENETITILFKVVGEGTDVLASYEPNVELECIGPNGNGFPFE